MKCKGCGKEVALEVLTLPAYKEELAGTDLVSYAVHITACPECGEVYSAKKKP